MNLNFLKNEKLRVMHETLKEKFTDQTAQIVFLEWKNNWLTVDAMAEHYKCNVPILYEIIAEGNRQNEAMAKQIKESEISPRKIQDAKEEEKVNAWDFVEKYYPDYSSSQEISNFLNFGTDNIRTIENENIMDALEIEYERDIYLKTIESFLEQQKIKEETTATITWSVKDFTDKAKDIFEDMEEHEKNGAETWQEYFDESKFPEALKGMIEDSDQEYGTTWGSVEYWLNENCKIKR